MPNVTWITADRPRFLGEPTDDATCTLRRDPPLAKVGDGAPTASKGGREDRSTEPTARARPQTARLYLWWLYVFLVCLVLPCDISLWVGPLRLSPYRIVLILALVPGIWMLCSGRAGRLNAADGFIALHAVWAALALLANHGLGEGLEPAGIYVIEATGSYLLARCGVRSPEDFRRVVRLLLWLVMALIPFAAYEGITGDALLRNTFRALFGGPPLEFAERRLGLKRPYVSFEHPILFGVFCSATLAMVFYSLARGFWGRLLRASPVGVATFLSVSSAALLAAAIQIALIAWDYATRRVPRRWLLLCGLFAALYVFIDVFGSRSPVIVITSRLTFSAETAYFRTYIFEHGIAEVWRHPLLGIGLGDWLRPEWMPPSVDNFWLLTAMRYGVPGFAFLVLAIIFSLQSLMRRHLPSPAAAEVRRGYLIGFFAMVFSATTVHLWGATFCLFLLLVGCAPGLARAGEIKGSAR